MFIQKIIKRIALQDYWHIYLTLAIALSVNIIFAWLYRNQINPDGVSYIQSARHYADFDFKIAINGYWSPLLSWLLVPFIWLGVDALHAYRYLMVILTTLLISALLYVLNRQKNITSGQKLAQLLVLTSFGILVAKWSYSVITPDLLTGLVLLLVLWMIYKYIDHTNAKSASYLGIALASLYLAKSIGFYVAIALIIFLIIYELVIRKKNYQYLAMTASIFLAVSAIWIGLISVKYDRLTISTAGSYNFALYGPDRPTHPQLKDGYLPTRHSSDVWAWDDPSYFTLPTWKITDNFNYYIHGVLRTSNESLMLLLTSTPLVYLGFLAVFKRHRNRSLNVVSLALIISSTLLLCAYSALLYVEIRYLWFILVPLVVYGSTIFLLNNKRNTASINIILLIVFISTTLSMIAAIKSELITELLRRDMKSLSIESRKHIPEGATVASPVLYDHCYHSNTRCVGNYRLTGNPAQDKSTIDDMRARNIDYYVDYSGLDVLTLDRVFKKTSEAHECRNYENGKIESCNQITLTIYKINPI